MRTYYIYDISTDEFLGEVQAFDSRSAELKAIKELNIMIDTCYIGAFSYKI